MSDADLRQFCKTLTSDYNEAVEDIENLEKTVQSLNAQLLACRNAPASDALAEQQALLSCVNEELARKQAMEAQLDTALDTALRTVGEYSTLCASTLGPAVEKSHGVVQRFQVFLTEMTAVHSEKVGLISQIDAEIREKQARLQSHDETVAMQQLHSAQVAALTSDCDEAKTQLHEMQRQLHEAQAQKQLHDAFDQLVETNRRACTGGEDAKALQEKLQNDVENIVAEHNRKHNLASEGAGVQEYGEAILRSVMVNISKYNQLELKLSAVSEDIQHAQETYLTEASKYEILEIDMTANSLMIAEMKNKIELLTQKHAEMCEANAACAAEQQTLQHTSTVLGSRIADCTSALADKTLLLESMKLQFDKDTADFSTVLREQSAEIARVNVLHDAVQLELAEKTELKNKLDSSISWDTGVIDKLKEKKLQIKTDMTAMRQEQRELAETSRTLQADMEHQTGLFREVQDAMSAKHSELAQCTQDCERVRLALLASSENESLVRARVLEVQHQLEDEMTLLARKQQLSDDIAIISDDLARQKTLVEGARDEAFRLDQEKTAAEQHLVHLQENIARCHALQVETDQLSTRNQDLRDGNESLSHAHSNLVDKISGASERLAQLHAELEELYSKQSDAENTLRAHDENMQKYTREQAECAELSVQLSRMQSDLVAMSLRKTNLHTEVKQIQDQIHVFQPQLQTICADLETRTCALTEVESSLQQKHADVASSHQQLQQSMRDREELSQISGQLDAMMKHVAGLQSQYEETQRAVAAQQGELDRLTGECNACQDRKAALEEQMTSVLFLIQEQQEKSQNISQETDEMSHELEGLLHTKKIMQLECAEIAREHEHQVHCAQTLNKALQQEETDIRARTQACKQLESELQARNNDAAQHLQSLEMEHENMCGKIEASSLVLSAYQDKLKHVNVYAQHIGIIVDKMQSLWNLGVDAASSSNNALVLSQVVLLLEEFMEWFESTFLYQLSLLSSEMITSQLIAYE